MIGFLDDNPQVRRRRVLGVKVLGSLDEAASHAIAAARADECSSRSPTSLPDACPSSRRRAERPAPLPARPADDGASPEPLAEAPQVRHPGGRLRHREL